MGRAKGQGMGEIWGATVRGGKAMVAALVTSSLALSRLVVGHRLSHPITGDWVANRRDAWGRPGEKSKSIKPQGHSKGHLGSRAALYKTAAGRSDV